MHTAPCALPLHKLLIILAIDAPNVPTPTGDGGIKGEATPLELLPLQELRRASLPILRSTFLEEPSPRLAEYDL